MNGELDELERELTAMRATFDLRWKADMRAIKRWQAAHPERELVWPDHADLVVWLLEELDDTDQRAEAFAFRLYRAGRVTELEACEPLGIDRLSFREAEQAAARK